MSAFFQPCVQVNGLRPYANRVTYKLKGGRTFCIVYFIKQRSMKFKSWFFAGILLLSTTVSQAVPLINNDPAKEKVANMTEAEKNARVSAMKLRVEEIKNMDRSNLSREDRKELRKELRSMNKEARALGKGGVYISLGGILLIILILLLIL